jgi:hypothetical protein
MTQRIPLDHLTSDQLDQLYEQLDHAETELRRYTEAESADAAAGSYAGRAEQAEAVIRRVRDLADDGPPAGTAPGGEWEGGWDSAMDAVKEVLTDHP